MRSTCKMMEKYLIDGPGLLPGKATANPAANPAANIGVGMGVEVRVLVSSPKNSRIIFLENVMKRKRT